MIISEIELFEALTEQLGKEKAKVIVHYVEAKAEKMIREQTDGLASKDDIMRLETNMANAKADIIKWMFVFWAGSILSILGGLFFFLKLFMEK